jgi:hypothetical protein
MRKLAKTLYILPEDLAREAKLWASSNYGSTTAR